MIGDHGYDPAAQSARGFKPIDIAAVQERFLRGKRLNTQPILLFIQGPNESADAKNKASYDKSYGEFKRQGLDMKNL